MAKKIKPSSDIERKLLNALTGKSGESKAKLKKMSKKTKRPKTYVETSSQGKGPIKPSSPVERKMLNALTGKKPEAKAKLTRMSKPKDATKDSKKGPSWTYVGKPIDVAGYVKDTPKVEPKKKTKKTGKIVDALKVEKKNDVKRGQVESNMARSKAADIMKDVAATAPEKTEEQKSTESGAWALSGWLKDNPTLLAGATSMLTGALMGDIGYGSKVGGKIMLDDEIKNLDFDRSRQLASAKAGGKNGNDLRNMQKYVDPATGKVLLSSNRSLLEGKEAGFSTYDEDRLASRKAIGNQAKYADWKNRKQNIVEFKGHLGETRFMDKETMQSRSSVPVGSLAPAQQKFVAKMQDRFHKEIDKGTRETYMKAAHSLQRMSKSQIAAKSALKGYILRTEGGRLTDFDVTFMQYLFGVDKYKQMMEEFSSGNLSQLTQKGLAAELSSELGMYRKRMQHDYEQMVAEGGPVDMSPSDVRKFIKPPKGLYNQAQIQYTKNGKPVSAWVDMDTYASVMDASLENNKQDAIKVLGFNYEEEE